MRHSELNLRRFYSSPFARRQTVRQTGFVACRENITDASTLQSVNLRQKHASLPCRGNSRYVFRWEINRSSWQYHHRQGLLYKDRSTILTYSDDRRATYYHTHSFRDRLYSHLRRFGKGKRGELDIIKKKSENDRCASYIQARISHDTFSGQLSVRITIGYCLFEWRIPKLIALPRAHEIFIIFEIWYLFHAVWYYHIHVK